jgi:hypothetical protein
MESIEKMGRAPNGLSVEQRFWRRVRVLDGCWKWIGSRDDFGYGTMAVDRKIRKTHRLSWEIHYGAIPPGMAVLHGCDNPECTNPGHLRLGTDADNSADRVARERQARGSRNSRAKLNEIQVAGIRRALGEGRKQADLAREHGVDPSIVSMIASRKIWRHV